MPINNTPIFPGSVNTCKARIHTGVDQASLGTSGNLIPVPVGFTKIFTAGANGSFVQKSRIKVYGDASFNVVSSATIVKIVISENSTNFYVYDEIYIPSMTITPTTLTPNFEITYNLSLGPGMMLWAGRTTGTTGSNGMDILTIGGDY